MSADSAGLSGDGGCKEKKTLYVIWVILLLIKIILTEVSDY
jgi:hypothetical protein